MLQLSVHGVDINIEPVEGVFTPTQHGLFYAQHVTVNPGERVIDIGCGSGILAIYAARRGGSVHATDVDERAVAAAAHNASLNGVEINARVAAMFGDDAASRVRKYDVILANLPNEIVAPAALERLDHAEAVAVAGGESGNALLLELLAKARTHMHATTRLYLPVHSLTDWHGTLRAAIDGYAARLVAIAELPLKPFVLQHIEWYRELGERGVISIFQRDGTWYSRGYVFALTMASRGS